MRPRNFKEAAQASLDERWYPMAKAKSIEEMNEIYETTDCALCELQASKPSKSCGRCPLNEPCDQTCSVVYQNWVCATDAHDFPEAHKQAELLVKRLEKIAGVSK